MTLPTDRVPIVTDAQARAILYNNNCQHNGYVAAMLVRDLYEKEIAELRDKLAQSDALLLSLAKKVIPGEVDSVDAFREWVYEKNEKLRVCLEALELLAETNCVSFCGPENGIHFGQCQRARSAIEKVKG